MGEGSHDLWALPGQPRFYYPTGMYVSRLTWKAGLPQQVVNLGALAAKCVANPRSTISPSPQDRRKKVLTEDEDIPTFLIYQYILPLDIPMTDSILVQTVSNH
jgi:hypothetical protein